MRRIALAATVLLGACSQPPAVPTTPRTATVVNSDDPQVVLENGVPLRIEGAQAGDQVDFAALEFNPANPFVPKARPISAKPAGGSTSALSREESLRCQQVAWEAVNSAATLERFRPRRQSEGPFQFRREGVTCHFDPHTPGTVAVAVPSGTSGYHGCYLEVTLDRTTCEVVGMEEQLWP